MSLIRRWQADSQPFARDHHAASNKLDSRSQAACKLFLGFLRAASQKGGAMWKQIVRRWTSRSRREAQSSRVRLRAPGLLAANLPTTANQPEGAGQQDLLPAPSLPRGS